MSTAIPDNAMNPTPAEMEKQANITINPKLGFIYDSSDNRGRRPFFSAHTSYFKTRKVFAKAVARAYENGYSHNH